jgi:uncharacterized protein (TIGR00255 family)
MTGFGRAAFQFENVSFDIEVRSVNHRYLDAKLRLPRPMQAFESELRGRIQARFSRGKLDLSVTSPAGRAAAVRVEIDIDAARAYLDAAGSLEGQGGAAGTLDVGTLMALPGVSRFVEAELSPEALRELLFATVDTALDALESMRLDEGVALERELLGRVTEIEVRAERIEGRSGEVQRVARERLRRRAEQLRQETGLLDEARLHQEVVIAADRLDITEELVRLRSHVAQFRAIVGEADAGTPVGRRLDFLLQEFGREANTVGSKASDAPVAHEIVELKTDIERLREQVQNVE